MSDSNPTVFLVDDDTAVLRGLTRLLSAAGMQVAAFSSPRDFLARLDPDATGCVVLDVAMPELDGFDLQRALAEKDSSLPVVFLTGHGDIPASVRAMKRGAADFLTKPVDGDALIAAVRNAFEANGTARAAQAGRADLERRLAALTPREREVLEGVVAGRLNKQIAADLGTVEKTIKVHRARVMDKMGARTLADLVRLVERAKRGSR